MDAIITIDSSQRIVLFNRAAEQIFGCSAKEAIGRSIDRFIPARYREAHARHVEAFGATGKSARRMGALGVLRALRADGAEFPIEAAISRTEHDGRTLHTVILRDVSERMRAEEALREQSLRDDLTGLYNRRGFHAIAERQVRLAGRTGTPFWLLFADIDGLKGINDALGHKEGDRAIADAARVLRETFRESDLIARIGGDEFVVLAVEVDAAGVERMVDRLRERLADFAKAQARPYDLSLSVGRSLYDPRRACSVEDLLARSDAAMYERKPSGRRSPDPEGPPRSPRPPIG